MKNQYYYDNVGVKYKYPNRSCKNCNNYPCSNDISTLDVDFAKYGCIMYKI